ncbi:MAG: hypothetical protein KJO38_07255, partial [Gammaproteobacteria bacterium]|nr:hypothetical protein [Gammaproteobacteria bacterium]
MKNPALICLGLLVAAFATTDAAAGPVADGIKRIGKESGRAVFSEVERRVLEDYVAGRGDASDDDDDDDYDRERPGKKSKGKEKNKDKQKGKPGNASQGNPKGLPPGIRMKLARGGTLPPGIAKKNLPADVEGRLPPVA